MGIMLAVFLLLAGCTPAVQVNHEVPQLDRAGEVIKKLVVEGCKPTKYAAKPIPQDVEISIKGDKVKANDGGVELLREFVTMKKLLK
jgi:hypothetical protein